MLAGAAAQVIRVCLPELLALAALVVEVLAVVLAPEVKMARLVLLIPAAVAVVVQITQDLAEQAVQA